MPSRPNLRQMIKWDDPQIEWKKVYEVKSREQACKFVCLMSDMSLSPCLSCLSFVSLETVIAWIGRLSVDQISSESDDRSGDLCEVVICKLDKLRTNYSLKNRSFYRILHSDRWRLKSYRSPVCLPSVYTHNLIPGINVFEPRSRLTSLQGSYAI
jgi:hypothetical protein